MSAIAAGGICLFTCCAVELAAEPVLVSATRVALLMPAAGAALFSSPVAALWFATGLVL